LTTKGTKDTKQPYEPRRRSLNCLFVSFVFFVVEKALVPAVAGMSGIEEPRCDRLRICS